MTHDKLTAILPRQDRFARVVTGKLPEAEFAFVDEVFKSNRTNLPRSSRS